MNDQGEPGANPRWEYRVVWRYGPLILMVAGLAMLGSGASGLTSAAISLAMLPIGFVCLVAGVALPQIEGMFTAGPQGISAPLLPVHQIDCYSVSGPAVAMEVEVAQVPALPPVWPSGPAMLGDVWDAIEEKLGTPEGFRDLGAACGTRSLEAPDGRRLDLTNRGFLDWRPASGELLELLASWGVTPVASGRYPIPSYADPGTVSARLVTPDGRPLS
jgi:hypothetical protein